MELQYRFCVCVHSIAHSAGVSKKTSDVGMRGQQSNCGFSKQTFVGLFDFVHVVDANTGNWRVNCKWRAWKCRTFKIALREIAWHKIARHQNAGHVLCSQKWAHLNMPLSG